MNVWLKCRLYDANGINIQGGRTPPDALQSVPRATWGPKACCEAAVAADLSLLRQAMLMDPLTEPYANRLNFPDD